MTNNEKNMDLTDKLMAGLDLAYQRMIAFKKYKNSEIVIMKGDKIIKIKPE